MAPERRPPAHRIRLSAMAKPKSTADDRRARSEAMKAEREAAQRAAERRSRLFIAVAVIAAVALVAVAVVLSRDSAVGGADAAVPAGVEAPDGGAPVGDAAAPVVMDEWVDFACPACKLFQESFGDTISDLVAAGDLRLVQHPLAFVTPEGSALAANAYGCAVDQGKTAEYYDALFANQGAESQQFTNDQLIAIGADVGLESDEFTSCVEGGTYDGWVANVGAAAAETLPAIRTPTIFLDGEEIELPATPDELVALVEAAASDS